MMQADPKVRWQEVRRVFEDLADRDWEYRDARLSSSGMSPDLRDEIRALLSSHDALSGSRRFETGICMNVQNRDLFQLSSGDAFGDCKILNPLGSGGMGAVYLAEQSRPRRLVALKIIRGDRFSLAISRRFERESDILARLQHPAIAQVYAAGTASGPDGQSQPFLMMEYIDGRPLTDPVWRDTFDLRQRIRLLSAVCDGVHTAHQMRVIHRDLKPGNVLVRDDGQPKILDFGVARVLPGTDTAVVAETDAGEILGTLAYISPEQLTQPSEAHDIRVDIYALGMIGYELVTGRLPYDVSGKPLSEIVSIISNGDGVEGAMREIDAPDLRCILGKALSPDRNRRYASAAALADDLRRFLDGDAISARRASLGYQLRVVARRNKVATIASAVAICALVVATAVSLRFAFKAERATAQAQQEARKLKAVNKFFLKDIFSAANPEISKGDDLSVRDMVDRAAETVDRIDDPAVRAEVYHAISGIYRSLATPGAGEDPLLVQAEDHAESALSLRASLLDPDNPVLGDSYLRLGKCQMSRGNHHDALRNIQHALAIFARADSLDMETFLDAKLSLATIHYLRRDIEKTKVIARDILSLLENDASAYPVELSGAYVFLGDVAQFRGNLEEAEAWFVGALRVGGKSLENRPLEYAGTIEKRGLLIVNMDRETEGIELLKQAGEIRSAILPPGSIMLVKNLLSMFPVFYRHQRFEEILSNGSEAIEEYEAASANPDHVYIAHARLWRGRALHALGRLSEAESEINTAIEKYESAKAIDDFFVANALVYRGEVYLAEGRCGDAISDAERASEVYSHMDAISPDKVKLLNDLIAGIENSCSR